MKKRNTRRYKNVDTCASSKLLLALSISAALPLSVHAQSGNSVIEEVVVTAEHREASLQDTQISLSALSADDLNELGISNGADIGYVVPNVTITELSSGRSGYAVNMRGIGQNESLLTFDPAIGLYIDDVLISKSTGSMMDALDMERIEVLRGPQGTLYGRNTMGGTLNIITRKPSDELGGHFKATLGKYNQRDLRGTLNIPLVDADSSIGSLAMKVSVASLNRDGLMDNVYESRLQDELETRNRDLARLQLLWQPSDRTEVMYSYDRTSIDEVPSVLIPTVSNPTRSAGVQVIPYLADADNRPTEVSIADFTMAKTEAEGHSLHLDYDISDTLTVKSISAYRTMENSASADSDGTPIELTGTEDEQDYDFFSQEFRLVGSALDNKLDYTVGLFYMDESGFVDQGTRIFGGLRQALSDFANENWAIYGQATYSLTERLRLTGGIRYTEEDRSMTKINIPSPGNVQVFDDAKGSFDNVSPMASISYDWTDDIMTYAKISTGFQSGGFNVRDSTPTDFTRGFDEETLTAYEVGIKSYLGDRVRLNAAFWYSDYDDKRVNQFNPETLASVVRNAGVVEIYGTEIEVLTQLTDSLQLGVNYGYTKPDFVKYDAPSSTDPDVILDLTSVTGFPYTPEHDANINLTYEHPLDFGLLRARLDWSYKSEYQFLSALPEMNSQDDHDLWNARLSLDDMAGPADTSIRVSAWIKNLTDEAYWVQGVASFNGLGFDKNTYGEPRTFGVDLSIDF